MGKIDNTASIDTVKNLQLPSIGSYVVPSVASQLYSWLRTFWTKLYKDKAFLRYLQGSRALKYAQLYLDLLENVQLLDHRNAPVFHRERWYPIIVRKNRRDESKASIARLGDSGIKLSTGAVAGYSDQLKLGEYTHLDDFVTYALDDDVKAVLSCIVDCIADPKVVLVNGSDFYIKDGSLVIRKERDPFTDDSGFATFEVPESPDEEGTEEAVLWACDTLIDKNFVYNFSGYAVGLQAESSEIYGRIVKSVWDATTDGLNPEHLRQVLAALCGVPCIISDEEKIEAVYTTGDFKQVITDKNTYTLGVDSVLRDSVKAGNSVYRGDFLDTAVRIYPFVVFSDQISKYTEFPYEQFKKDITSISIPSALIRSGSGSGFYVGWDEKDVECVGFDRNGNPKLRFDLGMDGGADSGYWQEVWDKYEHLGKSMSSCFKSLSGANISETGVCGKVVPIEFFLRNLIGANTLIIFVDTDKIAEDAPLYDPNFFNALRKLIPSQIRLYFVEHGTVVDEEYGDDIDTNDDEAEITVSESYDYDDFDDADDEIVSAKWQRKCRNGKRKNSEDDDDDDY